MLDDPARFVVVTGGPGAGKSTLVAALAASGPCCSVEAGRAVIQQQMAIDGPALPWHDPALFAELMLGWEMRSYQLAAAQAGRVYFDRGVPDVAGYLQLVGRPVAPHIERAARSLRYRREVFIAPPWQAIFGQDAERRQDFDEAVRTHAAMVDTYTRYGYELIELPCDSVEARVQFVLARLDA